MLCNKCGRQIPDDARFCGYCGSSQAQNPTQQPPMYTVPLQQNPQYTPQYTAPVQEPQYTAPVQQQYTVPAQQPQYTVPVQEAPQYAQTTTGTQPKKRIRKLPILLGAIAIVVLLMIANSGGEKETPEKSDPAKGSAVSSEPEVKSLQNYDSESFLFSQKDFAESYAKVLEKYGIPFKLSEYYATLPDGEQRDLLYKGKAAIYFNSKEDPATGKIIQVSAGHNSLTEGYKEITEEEREAILLIVEAAHGNMTEELWNIIDAAKPTLDTKTIDIYEIPLDGLMVKITLTATTYSVDVTIDGAGEDTSETAEPKADTGAATTVDTSAVLSRFPAGTLRFEGNAFKFTHEELAVLFQAELDAKGIPYKVGKYSVVEEVKYNYQLLDANGDKVAFMIWEVEPSTGKVIKAGINYTFQPNEDEHKYGFNAGFCLMEACHGNMGDTHWSYISDKKPLAERDTYTMYQYDLDGMEATMTIREENYNLGIKFDD